MDIYKILETLTFSIHFSVLFSLSLCRKNTFLHMIRFKYYVYCLIILNRYFTSFEWTIFSIFGKFLITGVFSIHNIPFPNIENHWNSNWAIHFLYTDKIFDADVSRDIVSQSSRLEIQLHRPIGKKDMRNSKVLKRWLQLLLSSPEPFLNHQSKSLTKYSFQLSWFGFISLIPFTSIS